MKNDGGAARADAHAEVKIRKNRRRSVFAVDEAQIRRQEYARGWNGTGVLVEALDLRDALWIDRRQQTNHARGGVIRKFKSGPAVIGLERRTFIDRINLFATGVLEMSLDATAEMRADLQIHIAIGAPASAGLRRQQGAFIGVRGFAMGCGKTK